MESDLKRRIMNRIYFYYTKELLWRYKEVFFTGGFIFVILTCVSFNNVLHNMPKDSLASSFNFLTIAVRKTELIVQLIMLSSIVALVRQSWSKIFSIAMPSSSA